MSKKDMYSFTVDVEQFVRGCLADPATKEMVYNAIRQGPGPVNSPMGASNLKDNHGDADEWYSVFIGSSTKIKSGEPGFLFRNGTGGQGPRVSIRLKKQEPKQHVAQTPGQLLPESGQTLLQKAIAGDWGSVSTRRAACTRRPRPNR